MYIPLTAQIAAGEGYGRSGFYHNGIAVPDKSGGGSCDVLFLFNPQILPFYDMRMNTGNRAAVYPA
jgi:hypothetical protein